MAKNQIVSIDIGTNAIKLVQLEQTASGIRLVSAGVEAYPRQSAVEEIANETISRTLQRLWKKVQGRKVPVALSMPRLLVTSRRLTNLPAAATDEQLDGLVTMQAETELPFRVEEAIYDYHDVRRSDSGVSVELIAAKRETVQQQIDYLKPLGIVPKAVIPSSLATGVLAGMQRPGHDKNSSDGMTMVMDIGAGRTDLCLMAGDTPCFSRSFPIGGNHLTYLYQSETGGNYEFAEGQKITNAALDRHSQSAAPTCEWVDGLVSELRRSIGGAKRELDINRDTLVSEIWLCGGGSRIAGLVDYIADQLQIPARLWNPLDAFEAVEDEQRSDTQSVDGFSNTSGLQPGVFDLAVALGLGVNALTHQISLDLLLKEERAKLTQAAQRKRTLTAVAAGIILLVGLGLSGLTWSRAHQVKIAVLDQEIRNIRRTESNARKALVKNLAITDLLTPRVSPLDVLRELSLRFADRTKVAWKTFNISRLDDIERAKITFNIESKSHQEVSQMISGMAQSGIFTNIKSGQITSIERNKKPIFQAQVTCNLASDAARTFAQTRYLNMTRPHLNRDGKQKADETETEKVSQEDGKSTIDAHESSDETSFVEAESPEADAVEDESSEVNGVDEGEFPEFDTEEDDEEER
jgi:type IV pilus assembly protein PilM